MRFASFQNSLKHDLDLVKTVFKKARYEVVDRISDWVIVEGWIDKVTYQVRPADDGWIVEETPLRFMAPLHFAKRHEAIAEAKRRAEAVHGHMTVLNRDGHIQSHKSFWPAQALNTPGKAL